MKERLSILTNDYYEFIEKLTKYDCEFLHFVFENFCEGYDYTVDEEIEFFDKEDENRYRMALEMANALESRIQELNDIIDRKNEIWAELKGEE